MENSLTMRNNGNVARLETLAQEARNYAYGAAFNMLQLGRVFIEAKSMLKHGEFEAWCEANAGCSMRTAQNMMSAYTRFGEKDEFLQFGKSKLFKMLTLPEGTEDQFVKDHDVANMSSREVEQAIRETKGDIKTEHKAESPKPQEDDRLVNELRSVKEERDRFIAQNKELLEARRRLNDEIREIKSGSEMDADLISEQQKTIDELSQELDRYRVAEARGEVGRTNGDLSADDFRTAVHEFMGSVHQVPQMGSLFASMDNGERVIFDTLLKSVEAWAKAARQAIDTIEGRFV